jgi:hypothetical protein
MSKLSIGLIILFALTTSSCYFETRKFIFDPANDYRLFDKQSRVLNRIRKCYDRTATEVWQEYGTPDYVTVMSHPQGGVFYVSAYWMPSEKEIALLAFTPVNANTNRYVCTSVTYMPKKYWSPKGYRKP